MCHLHQNYTDSLHRFTKHYTLTIIINFAKDGKGHSLQYQYQLGKGNRLRRLPGI